MKIGIFYGSTTGNTQAAAEKIKSQLESIGEVSLIAIGESSPAEMSNYDVVILGASTWGFGDMQDDWIGSETLAGANLNGKKVAVFGLGDQSGFADTFVDAIGILGNAAKEAGAELIGSWPVNGYDFNASVGMIDGKFIGLALDDDTQPELTEERITQWCIALKNEITNE